jgi:hypothetical protein
MQHEVMPMSAKSDRVRAGGFYQRNNIINDVASL